MKPLKIVMTAFGPYAEEQVIDFTLLEDNTFFLVHGPTGAGKSSILDAICFALYGETSGNERSGKHMRSDHSDPQMETVVIFDFMIKDKSYRVHRVLEYERPKKHGDGTTKVPAKATLWERTGIKDESKDGTVLAYKVSNVTGEIEKLLGFRVDQFRQVIMLPQGQFRKLLLATSGEREKILEILFNTEFYRIIQEKLKEEAKAISREIDSLKEKRDLLLSHHSAITDEDLRDKKDQISKEIIDLDGSLLELNDKEKVCRKDLEYGVKIRSKAEEFKKAENNFLTLEKRKSEIDKLEERIKKGRKTLPLQEGEKNLKEREKEYKEGEKSLKKAEIALGKAEELYKKAEIALRGEEEKERVREKLKKELHKLNELPEKVKKLEGAGIELDKIQKEILKKEIVYNKEKKELEKTEGSLKAYEREFLSLKEISSTLEGRRLKVKESGKILSLAEEVKKLEPEEKRAGDDYGKEKANLEGIERKKKDLEKKKDEIEEAWLSGQASVIAGTLKSGSPCPVCGSKEHPSPAHREGQVPSETVLKKAKKEFKEIEESYEKSGKILTDLRGKMDRLTTVLEEKKNSLGEFKESPLPHLRKKYELYLKEEKEGEEASKKLLNTEKLINELSEKEKELKESIEKGTFEIQKLKEERVREEKTLEHLKEEVHPSLRSIKSLEEKIKEKEKDLKKLKEALLLAMERHSEIKGDLQGKREALKASLNYYNENLNKFSQGKDNFQKALLSSGFKDENDYHSSCLTSSEIEKSEKEIQNYRNELHTAEKIYSTLSLEIKGLDIPDTDKIERELQELKKSIKENTQEKGKLQERAVILDNTIKDLKNIKSKYEILNKSYSITGRLSEVSGGKNALRITFQRYVLAALLDDILIAANCRLHLMSHKRYSLRRSSEGSDMRKGGGLDLMVDDSYTGMARPVSTLSGGESFLASLSLALGLADVVQTYAGGIKLDTIFIDEGFGTLDPEALDLAFRALVDLQTGGRLVGIISHVPELKERINARLEVIPGRKGSRARFII